MKKIICILMLVCTLVQCANSTSPNSTSANDTTPAPLDSATRAEAYENLRMINEYILRFQIYNDTTTLDSMLIQMDKITTMDDWMEFVIKKVWALSATGKNEQAILYLKGINESLLNTMGPNYKEITILRLKTIKSLKEGNKKEADKYVKKILSYLSQYKKEHKAEIRNYLSSANSTAALTGFEFLTLYQYYFYYSYIYGQDKAFEKMDEVILKYPESEFVIDLIKGAIEEFEMTSFTII